MTTKTIKIRNIKISYIEIGEGSMGSVSKSSSVSTGSTGNIVDASDTVLFLHGGGLRASTYSKMLNNLAIKYRVIAPDLPGFGNSSVPNFVWNYSGYVNYLNEFIKNLNLNNIILIGHSLGGGIAIHLAVKSNKIKKLILIDSVGIPPKYSRNKLALKLINKSIKELVFMKDRKTAFITIKDFLHNIVHQDRNVFTMAKTVENLIYFENKNVFDRINVPTLILWGTQDELFCKDIAYKFSQLIKNSELKFINGNHDWVLLCEKFKVTNDLILLLSR